jgi:2-furoyl-CoA dehydrogenase large subunit
MVFRRVPGKGEVTVAGSRDALWRALLDPASLQGLVPGAETIEMVGPDAYRAALSYGVARFRGRYVVDIRVDRSAMPGTLGLAGEASGPLGSGSAVAAVHLDEAGPGQTRIRWDYDGSVTGAVAFAGTALLTVACERFVAAFFRSLSGRAGTPAA